MGVRNKILVLFVLVGALLFLSGCTNADGAQQAGFRFPGSGSSGDSSVGSGSSKSVSSKGGVSLSFVEGSPPDEMIKGESYTFAFIFTNDQKHDITDLKLRTRGYDRSFINGLGDSYSISQIPAANDVGGSGLYSKLIVSDVNADGFTGDFNFDPIFDYCYTAKSTYREQVCVPSNKNICDIDVESSSDHNGPITINVDRISVASDVILIPINFRNSGPGEVVNSCFSDEAFQFTYTLVGVKLGSQDGDCKPLSNQEYVLVDGESSIICEFSRNSQDESAYATQLTVDLEYLYEQTESLDITVKDFDEFLN